MDLLEFDVTTFLVFLATFLLVYFHTKRQNGVPPGPNLLPIIGNIHVVANTDMLATLAKLRRKYGDIFGLYIGGKLSIFLNGFDTIHAAFLKKGSTFKGRPKSKMYGSNGIIFASDSTWKEQRGFSQKALNTICFSDKSKNISDIIAREIGDLINRLGSYNEPFDIDNYLTLSVLNIVLHVVFHHRCDLDDPALAEFLNTVRGTAADFFVRDAIYSCLPFLSWLPSSILIDSRTTRFLNGVVVDFIRKGREPKQNKNADFLSFVSLYTMQMDSNKTKELKNSVNDENMRKSGYELIAAGSDTTSGTIRWIILHLIRHPEIQEKMFNEIHKLEGDGIVQIEHKRNLPYVQAVVLEGLRVVGVAPLGVPHSVPEDTQFRGYLFPKNCTILSNISSVLTDPSVWQDPEEFRPERFLSDDGQTIIVPPQFIPFSLGPRSCVGETLARMELFLFVANLVKTFRLLPETDGEIPPASGIFGLTYHPVTFKMRVTKREH